MKSAYELAMEKLEKNEPSFKLSDEQRQRIAEIDEKFKAKIAERETFLDSKISEARAAQNLQDVEELEDQRRREIAGLKEDCELQKDKVRNES